MTQAALREQLLDPLYDGVRQRTYVALDVDRAEAAQRLVDTLGPGVNGYKVGLELFHAEGMSFVQSLMEQGKRVFLDVKLHDIPTTVYRALRVICRQPIEMVNVHAAGGRDMLQAARQAVDESEHHPLLIGVTVLTSLADADIAEMGMDLATDKLVMRWAKLCKDSGCDGVVASALDVSHIYGEHPADFVTVVPGTRPTGSARNDQQRTLTPGEAIRRGATHLVMGRAVTTAEDPVEALAAIWDEMKVC